jgi:mannose-6-phosphate isomerase-like protein (cupin superfamily)
MDVIQRDAVIAFTTKDTSTIRELLAPRNSGIARQSLAEATLPPGAETEAHFHPNTEEIYYLLQGQALMAIEGERQAVGPGEAIAIPPGSRHQIRNTGTENLIFLCCCVPAYTHEDTVMCAPLLTDLSPA